jgi:hypothetical protein
MGVREMTSPKKRQKMRTMMTEVPARRHRKC